MFEIEPVTALIWDKTTEPRGGLASLGPFLIPMRRPCYDRLASDSPATDVTGTFAIDLFETDALRHREPQVYYLYAFSDRMLAGPVKFELLSPAV